MYEKIARYMHEYFMAYSEDGQAAETIHAMDRFYAPDLNFDDGLAPSRERWYQR